MAESNRAIRAGHDTDEEIQEGNGHPEVLGRVHSIETFGSVDGPGVRFVIFLQGCAMRCRYCHNVDTWDPDSDKLKLYTPRKLLDQAERYKPYWGTEGGITVSGGEALLQIDFLTELFRQAKERGINTCLDTAGQPFTRQGPFFRKFEELMRYTDLLLMDLKHIDPQEHRKLTGHDNARILDLFRYLSDIGKPIWIRHVLVPGITDNDEYLYRTRAFIETLHNVERIEVLPYHSMGEYKWDELGIPYTLHGVKPPTQERVRNAERILRGEKVRDVVSVLLSGSDNEAENNAHKLVVSSERNRGVQHAGNKENSGSSSAA